MKHVKKKKNLLLCIVLIVALVFVLISIFCWKNGNNKKYSDNSFVTEKENIIEEPLRETEESFMEENVGPDNGIEINTPYGVFYYPEIWGNDIRVEESEKGEYNVTLYGKVDKMEEKLFTIFFEKNNVSGYLFGTLSVENTEKVNVSIEMTEFIPDENCSDDNIDKIYAMQEDVNYIIEQLYALDSFEPVGIEK